MSTFVTARDIHVAHAEAHQAQYRTQRYIAWESLNASQIAVYQCMASLLNKQIALAVHRCCIPPIFEENTQDIPVGYGIEQSADGGFYPYEINIADTRQIAHLKDSDGLDRRCASRDEALSAIMEEVLHAGD